MPHTPLDFRSERVDIDVPDNLNTDELREWLIRKLEAIDIQRKQYKQIIQRYSNTGRGKKQYTPEQIAVIHAEQTLLHEQRNAYRTLIGDINAANKKLNQITSQQAQSRQFSEHFLTIARELLPAQEFQRIFNETLKRIESASPGANGTT